MSITKEIIRAEVAVDSPNIYLILHHDKGRTILELRDNGEFVPLEPESAGALADFLVDAGEEARERVAALRESGGLPTDWSEVRTSPNDPRHVTEILNHIAHLDGDQEEEIRAKLEDWREKSREVS
jgi:hypothetical protein